MQVAFVGLGVMGEPICRNILNAHQAAMTVFDLNPDPVARLVGDGARPAQDVGGVARESDIVLLSLPGGREVEETVLGATGLLAHGHPGQIVVDRR